MCAYEHTFCVRCLEQSRQACALHRSDSIETQHATSVLRKAPTPKRSAGDTPKSDISLQYADAVKPRSSDAYDKFIHKYRRTGFYVMSQAHFRDDSTRFTLNQKDISL